MSITYVFIPEIPYINDIKSKEEIVAALNEKYPEGKFDPSKIIISRKDNKYHAYAQTTQEQEENLLKLGDIKIAGKTVPVKKCCPNHQIYINKLPDNCSKQEITKYFSNFGKIVNVELFPAEGTWDNPKQKSNINHCYIRFENDQDAEKCLFSEERHAIKNNDPIRVVRAYKIGQNDQTDKKLFLKISPLVQKAETQKLEKQLYNELLKFGKLRQKIRIEQLSNQASKALITFTSIQAGENALKNFNTKLEVTPQRTFVLRPFASKQSYMAFLGGLRSDVTQEKIKTALEKYGKVLNCTINPSKKQGILNAVASFAEEQSFKLALSDYKYNQDLVQLFAFRPFMDIHMSATLRNDYNNFRKKDKKPIDTNMMNMGGIGVGFGLPQRMNQPPQQPFIGGSQQMGPMGGMNPMGPMGMGMNQPMLGNFNKMMPPQNNPNFGRPN